MPLLPHQERLLVERGQLQVRLIDLKNFLNGPGIQHLTNDEQQDLFKQVAIMEQYHGILNERIARFQKG